VLSEPVKSAPHPGLMRHLSAHEGELATCAIVWHELVYGAARLPRSRKRRAIEAYLDEAVRAAPSHGPRVLGIGCLGRDRPDQDPDTDSAFAGAARLGFRCVWPNLANKTDIRRRA